MPDLQTFAVDPARLGLYTEALTRALEGTGPALVPYAAGSPSPDLSVDETADHPDDLALVMSTSGSTGTPKRALLTRENLIASAEATHERLGGPGQWLLPMPAHHIAGTQVLIRAMQAGTIPTLLNLVEGFDPDNFADAVAWMAPSRRYTSLVPTLLGRLLDHDGGRAALTSFDAVLLGGAAIPPTVLAQAKDAGVNVVTTYGMSETAGGCVYDGRPLAGTTISLDEDGRIGLTGPTVAHGYLADEQRTRAAFELGEARTFWTDDIGALSDDGLLSFVGRRDDLINTGGVKVAPRVVEDAVTALPDVAEAVAVPTPDREFGQAVSLAIVLRADAPGPTLVDLRTLLEGELPAYALPRRLLILDALPSRGPGKPDRAAIAALPGWQNHPDGS